MIFMSSQFKGLMTVTIFVNFTKTVLVLSAFYLVCWQDHIEIGLDD